MLRRFKEESEFRFRYVKFVVSFGRDPGRAAEQVVESVGSEPVGEVELGQPCPGAKLWEPVLRYGHY